jgi:hypothetical protein
VIAIVQKAHQGGDPERAGHQHDFVMAVGRALPHLDEDRGGLAEFRFSQPDVADKAVQMLDLSRSRGSDVRSITVRTAGVRGIAFGILVPAWRILAFLTKWILTGHG